VKPLSTKQLRELNRLLAERREVARALLVPEGSKPKPTLMFEYDERPADVDAARTAIQELVAAVAPALGDAAYKLGFSAGGPEDVASIAPGGKVIYERE
jgi:hypothetical protein